MKAGTLKQKYYPWVIMVSCCIFLTGVYGLGTNCSGIFLQPVAQSLGVGVGEISTFATVLCIASAACTPLVGGLINKIDIRILMSVAVVLEGLGYVLLGSVNGIWGCWLLGAVIGVGLAFGSYLTVTVLLNNWFIKGNGTVTGIVLSASSFVSIIVNPILSSIIEKHSWRTGYRLVGTAILCTVVVIWLFIRKKPSDLGCRAWGDDGAPAEPEIQPAAASKKKNGDRSVLRSLPFLISLSIAFITSLVIAHLGHLPNLASTVGLPVSVGAMMSSCGLAGEFAGKLGVGGLTDRLGVFKAVSISIGIGIAGMLGLMFIGAETAWLAFVCSFAYGVVCSIGSVGYPLITKALVGEEHYAKCYAYISVTSTVGYSIGFPMIGHIFDATGTYSPTFVIAIAGSLLATALLLAAARKKNRANSSGVQ